MATAMQRSVVLCPYDFSMDSMMKGMTAPEAPDEAEMSPNAMPLRRIHHSSTMLMMG